MTCEIHFKLSFFLLSLFTLIYLFVLIFSAKNIICTSRDKWYVESTITDERVRKELMYILLDSFCNEFVEHAFFLFQFLLKDQCSQYYPIGKVESYRHIFS